MVDSTTTAMGLLPASRKGGDAHEPRTHCSIMDACPQCENRNPMRGWPSLDGAQGEAARCDIADGVLGTHSFLGLMRDTAAERWPGRLKP